MSRTALPARRLISLLALSSFALAVQAAPAADDDQRVEELEQRLLVLERKLELQQEEAATKAKDAPAPSAGEKGFAIKSGAGDYEIKFNAVGQVDGRYFFSDDGAFDDGFVTRRLRPTLQGSLGKLVGFRFTPEFAGAVGAGDSASIVDAYFDLKFHQAASVRVGKQKGPVGLERLQSGGAIGFVERGFPTELAPNRDLGVALFGELLDSKLSYTLGIFNGTADGRDVAAADDGLKEFAGRVFFEPFKTNYSALKGLGFGVAGSAGAKDGTGNNFVSRYRTPGQNQFFTYNETGVAATGAHQRISPQARYYYNSLGLIAEYIESEQDLSRGGVEKSIKNEAWSVSGSWVITGEDASYRGVKPGRPYTVGGEGWGALELVARAGSLDVDNSAFAGVAGTDRLANPNSQASKADSYGVAVNWYLSSNAKLTADYNETRFDGGAAAGADRRDEKALFTRLTIQY